MEDDGPGLSAEQRAQVGERGERLDESVPGSGLGLAIVRDISKLYGGFFALDASPLGGLLARLELPAIQYKRNRALTIVAPNVGTAQRGGCRTCRCCRTTKPDCCKAFLGSLPGQRRRVLPWPSKSTG